MNRHCFRLDRSDSYAHAEGANRYHEAYSSLNAIDYGEGVSAHRSTVSDVRYAHSSSEHDSPEYGEDFNGDRDRKSRRPRRNAAQRRAQQLRSDSRMLCRMLAGLDSIDAHRGGELSRIGSILRNAIVSTRRQPSQKYGRQQQICRHWARGCCTYGDRCRFLHPSNNDDHEFRHQCGHNVNNDYTGDFKRDDYSFDDTDTEQRCPDSEAEVVEPINDYVYDCLRTKLLLDEFRTIATQFADSHHENHANRLENDAGDTYANVKDTTLPRDTLPTDDDAHPPYDNYDDIDNIIDIVTQIAEESDRQSAINHLPKQLLSEVSERLARQPPESGTVDAQQNELLQLQIESSCLDRTLAQQGELALRLYNNNKKLARRCVGSQALVVAIRARRLQMSDAGLSSSRNIVLGLSASSLEPILAESCEASIVASTRSALNVELDHIYGVLSNLGQAQPKTALETMPASVDLAQRCPDAPQGDSKDIELSDYDGDTES